MISTKCDFHMTAQAPALTTVYRGVEGRARSVTMGLWRKALTSMNATLLSSKQCTIAFLIISFICWIQWLILVYCGPLAALGLQLKLQPEKDIFLFNAKESVANWTATSDRSIGGTTLQPFIVWVVLDCCC